MNNEPSQSITVLPLGAWEQHGPHLPMQTDTIIASEFASRLKKHIFPAKINVLPTEPIGYSVEHLDFDGSKSLSYDEAISNWLTIIKEQVQKGHRKILLLNAHGGNSPLLTIVATEARVRWNVLVVVT
ncbi:MAG: creatininase family protein, partial [Lentilitoribacter sp.]